MAHFEDFVTGTCPQCGSDLFKGCCVTCSYAEDPDPRRPGQIWFSSYWQETYTVLERDGIHFKVRWHGDGRWANGSMRPMKVVTHCTAFDPKDKRVS